jgi:Domain of unknown function (DUF4314)
MRHSTSEDDGDNITIPTIGDRVERIATADPQRGTVRGTVHYADHLQILVKWDDGSSSSLRVGRDRFRIIRD